jgi:hypothetical protein
MSQVSQTTTEVYQAFKAAIVFSKSHLDRVYDSTLSRHFYTEIDRQALKAKWAVTS